MSGDYPAGRRGGVACWQNGWKTRAMTACSKATSKDGHNTVALIATALRPLNLAISGQTYFA